MKYKGHIATGSYEFVEIESDDRDELISEYFAIKSTFNDVMGHNSKEWARVRREYATNNEISIEDMEACNKSQRYFINQMKLIIRETNKE